MSGLLVRELVAERLKKVKRARPKPDGPEWRREVHAEADLGSAAFLRGVQGRLSSVSGVFGRFW